MRLRSLHLSRFRNYEQAHLPIEAPRLLLAGANGQGKTNLLEAIHFTSLFRSFRVHDGSSCAMHGGDHFQIRAELEDDELSRDLLIHQGPDEKTVRLDQKALPSLRRHFRNFPVFLVAHRDLDLALGAPSGRRDSLDRFLSLVSEPYAAALRTFQRALKQRNAALRLGQTGEEWFETLGSTAAAIETARARFLTAIRGRFRRHFQRFFDLATLEGDVRLVDRDGPAPESLGTEEAVERLVRNLAADRAAGTTTWGPHRDDLAFTLGGRPLRDVGSQGQVRLFVWSYQWTLGEYLGKILGRRPALLLDDVFADLDAERTARVFEALRESPQVFLTTPRHSLLEPHTEDWQVVTVEGGVLTLGATASHGRISPSL